MPKLGLPVTVASPNIECIKSAIIPICPALPKKPPGFGVFIFLAVFPAFLNRFFPAFLNRFALVDLGVFIFPAFLNRFALVDLGVFGVFGFFPKYLEAAPAAAALALYSLPAEVSVMIPIIIPIPVNILLSDFS